jgi:hypothetical protein
MEKLGQNKSLLSSTVHVYSIRTAFVPSRVYIVANALLNKSLRLSFLLHGQRGTSKNSNLHNQPYDFGTDGSDHTKGQTHQSCPIQNCTPYPLH